MTEERKTARRRKPWPPETVLDKPARLTDDRIFQHSVISPLRYPGAKRQLVPVIEELIRANVTPPRLLIEPFCGGATTTLRLLGADVVPHGVLSDVDPLVSAFWRTAAFDSQWLLTAMREETVTVSRWDWWRSYEPRDRRGRALKCLFLNRTTFSGILHGRAGPIGGRAQSSAYKIDCRYGLEGLERRIRAVADLASSGRLLDVWDVDWRTALKRVSLRFGNLEKGEIAIYLDPPYVDKARWLYEWSFDSREHACLAAALSSDAPYSWLLSYDDTPAIRELYTGRPGQKLLHVSHRYTAAGSESRTVKDELLVTNLLAVPFSGRYRILAS